MLPGVAISRQSGYFGKPVAGKNLWLVATMIVAILGLRIGLFVAIFGLDSESGYLWLFLDLKLKWLCYEVKIDPFLASSLGGRGVADFKGIS